MRLIEKIAYIGFWINILILVFSFVGAPILFVSTPDIFEVLSENKGSNPYYLTISFLNLIAFFHWGYCIWFLFKYDRYSKSIFPLLFLNMLYAPFYYYRVKIKKRPLRNKVNIPEEKEQESEQEDHSISDQEFLDLTRENIIRILRIWSSKLEQLELQKVTQGANVTSELIEYWSDYSLADIEVLNEVFIEDELEMLSRFGLEISNAENVYNGSFPEIEEFQKTTEWKKLNLLAEEILRSFTEENTVGNHK
jgi:hypothetical protein